VKTHQEQGLKAKAVGEMTNYLLMAALLGGALQTGPSIGKYIKLRKSLPGSPKMPKLPAERKGTILSHFMGVGKPSEYNPEKDWWGAKLPFKNAVPIAASVLLPASLLLGSKLIKIIEAKKRRDLLAERKEDLQGEFNKLLTAPDTDATELENGLEISAELYEKQGQEEGEGTMLGDWARKTFGLDTGHGMGWLDKLMVTEGILMTAMLGGGIYGGHTLKKYLSAGKGKNIAKQLLATQRPVQLSAVPIYRAPEEVGDENVDRSRGEVPLFPIPGTKKIEPKDEALDLSNL